MPQKKFNYYMVSRLTSEGVFIEEEYDSYIEAEERSEKLIGMGNCVSISEVTQKVIYEE